MILSLFDSLLEKIFGVGYDPMQVLLLFVVVLIIMNLFRKKGKR